MKLWITRTKRRPPVLTDGVLRLHYKRPTYKDGFGWNHVLAILDGKEFPEVTFENSPKLVEIKLVKED